MEDISNAMNEGLLPFENDIRNTPEFRKNLLEKLINFKPTKNKLQGNWEIYDVNDTTTYNGLYGFYLEVIYGYFKGYEFDIIDCNLN